MQFNAYPPQTAAAPGASSTAYSAASPSAATAQLAYRLTPGAFSTDHYNSYSSYPTPVTEYPPYPLSAASYDPVAAAPSPISNHLQHQQHHQQHHHHQPPPSHYTFPSTPATTECVGISIHMRSYLRSSLPPLPSLPIYFPLSLTTSSSSSSSSSSTFPEPIRRISLPLSTTQSPPMYSPASYSAQGHSNWHRDRSGSDSFPADLPYHLPAAAAVAAIAAHGLTRYESSPLSATASGNARWQPHQHQHQFCASPPANQGLPQGQQQQPHSQTQQHQHQQHQHQHQHQHQQNQYQPQPLPSIARSNCPPSTTTTGTGSPEAEPQPHLQSNSVLPSAYNAGYPYYAQPAAAPPAPATGIRTSPLTSIPAYPSLNTDLAAPFNTGLPSLAAVGTSALSSTVSAPSASLSPAVSARSTSSQHSTAEGDDGGVSPRRRPRMRGIIPTSMRELEPNVKQEIDNWLLRYLNRLCGDGTSPFSFTLPFLPCPPQSSPFPYTLPRPLNRFESKLIWVPSFAPFGHIIFRSISACPMRVWGLSRITAEAKDRMGHLIHQSYTSKRTQRYEQMYGWRPLKFRIEAFVNGFIDLVRFLFWVFTFHSRTGLSLSWRFIHPRSRSLPIKCSFSLAVPSKSRLLRDPGSPDCPPD